MMDHINSYGRPELGDKSPYEMFEFYYGKEILDLLSIHKIPANEIILKPELLKHKQRKKHSLYLCASHTSILTSLD